MWAQRVIARKGQPAHALLELKADATADQAQAAFHKIARTAHPDLHRQGLTAEELEMLTSAYAAVAGAYQELRTRTMATTRLQPLQRTDGGQSTPLYGTSSAALAAPPSQAPVGNAGTSTAAPRITGHSPPIQRPGTAPSRTATAQSAPIARPPAPAASAPASAAGSAANAAASAMSSKAQPYYRKAESALNRGDLKGAILQLKLAVATDPTSTFLRSALAEVETEVRKTT